MDRTKTTSEVFDGFAVSVWHKETRKERQQRYDFIKSFRPANPTEYKIQINNLVKIERLITSLIGRHKVKGRNFYYKTLMRAQATRKDIIVKLSLMALEEKPSLTDLPLEVLVMITSRGDFGCFDRLSIQNACTPLAQAMELTEIRREEVDMRKMRDHPDVMEHILLDEAEVKILNYSEEDFHRDDKLYRLACQRDLDEMNQYGVTEFEGFDELLSLSVTSKYNHHRELIDYTCPIGGNKTALFGESGLLSRMTNLRRLTFENCFFRRVLGREKHGLDNLSFLELKHCHLDDIMLLPLWIKIDTIVFRCVTHEGLKRCGPNFMYQTCLKNTVMELNFSDCDWNHFPGLVPRPVRRLSFDDGQLRFVEDDGGELRLNQYVVPHEVIFEDNVTGSVISRRCLAFDTDLEGEDGLFSCKEERDLGLYIIRYPSRCFDDLDYGHRYTVATMKREILDDRIKFTFYVDLKSN